MKVKKCWVADCQETVEFAVSAGISEAKARKSCYGHLGVVVKSIYDFGYSQAIVKSVA
jgi:hypothetical protein